jgi:hypothetical protein
LVLAVTSTAIFFYPLFKEKLFCGFSLYVGAAVYRVPQEWQRGILLFGFALFFNACCGVAHAIFTTRPTWLHVETTAMWMWKHVSTTFFLHKNQ